MPLKADLEELAKAIDTVIADSNVCITCSSAPGYRYKVVGLVVEEFEIGLNDDEKDQTTTMIAVRHNEMWS